MKAQFGIKIKNKNAGFSTLEIMIALTVIIIVLAGAASANFAAQYWSITSETSNEALYKAKTVLENYRALVKQDFYQATSSPILPDACVSGQLCYFTQNTITDLSPCSKYVKSEISWQVSGYPTTTTALFTNLTNVPETINLGGDCLLAEPAGNWTATPQSVGVLTFTPGKVFTGIDLLRKKIYAVAATSPYFMIYDSPAAAPGNPVPLGSTAGSGTPLNALDTARNLSTGRIYSFVAQASSTSQLGVIDATDETTPVLVAERRLSGTVPPTGSFPEGWRVVAYGNRLYITTRETAGYEFHIFDITLPASPTEVGSGMELNRTVNDMIVRDQKIGGITHRFVYLAADADTKELGVLDVTGDVISEVNSVSLPGTEDGLSLYLLGNNLYFGRANNATGPELYVFDASNPTVSLPIIATGEVGADVVSLRASGAYVFAGTKKVGQEFQVWKSEFTLWNPSILNFGRLSSAPFAKLAPLGFDIDGNWVYAVSQLVAGDSLQIFYAP